MKTHVIKSMILLLILATMAVEPVFSQNQEQLFQKALMKEEGEGALQEAIDIYTKIVENSSAERSLQANALLQIGLCYEKLGKKQATEAYNKVITQFADQQQTAEIAKTRLQRLNTKINAQKGTITYKPEIKQIPLMIGLNWDFSSVQEPFDFSPDGKKFVYRGIREKPGKDTIIPDRQYIDRIDRLYIADISGAPVYLLTDPPEFVVEARPRFSPDGKHIAFAGVSANEDLGSADYTGAIYVVNADGGKPRQISGELKSRETSSMIWLLDNKHVSYLSRKGIVTNNLTGETTNTIPLSMKYDFSTKLTGYSPDGKWISYFTKNRDVNNQLQFDCWLVSSTGEKQIRLTRNKGFDGFGAWSEKDYSFYFVSDRKGDRNIFRIKIDPETGEKKGDAEQVTFYYDAHVFSPKFIKDKSALAYGLVKEIKQIVIPENESFDSYKTIATGDNAILSPDGKTVYFIGVGKNNQGIYSVPRTGGTKIRLSNLVPCTGIHNWNFYSLSPDGSTIAFFTKKGGDKLELCFLSTNTGKLSKSININNFRGAYPTWSPDSKKVAYAKGKALYTIPVWGNKAKKLVETSVWEPWSIRWSPDGKYIAGFVYLDDDYSNDIVIVSTQNGEVKRLTTKEEYEYKEKLEWHPGSKKLTYFYYDPENDYDGLREAYVDGSPTTQMIDQPDVWDYVGTWDPTGTNYYFIGDASQTDHCQLYKYNAKSKKITPFSDIPYFYHSLPSWSKDGKFMVLHKGRIEYQLWMMEDFE